MNPFAYSRPDTLADILDRLAADEDARPIAGGMTLLPTLKQRLAAPSELVDLSAISFLVDIDLDEDGLTIGAMATHVSVATSPLVREALPGIADLAAQIGDVQVRNRGTIGGSVANNDPAADYPAALLALGAKIITDRREIAAEDFFTGLFETALETGELIVAVRFPVGIPSAYRKFRHPISGYAMAGVYVAVFPDGPRVAVTGAGPGVFRATGLESALAASFTGDAARTAELDQATLSSDMHADALYRRQLVRTMAARAVTDIIAAEMAPSSQSA